MSQVIEKMKDYFSFLFNWNQMLVWPRKKKVRRAFIQKLIRSPISDTTSLFWPAGLLSQFDNKQKDVSVLLININILLNKKLNSLMQHQRGRACKNLLFENWPAGIGITGRYLVLIQSRDGAESGKNIIIINVVTSKKYSKLLSVWSGTVLPF